MVIIIEILSSGSQGQVKMTRDLNLKKNKCCFDQLLAQKRIINFPFNQYQLFNLVIELILMITLEISIDGSMAVVRKRG